MSQQSALTYEVRDEIAFITLNRPEKLNVLDGELSDLIRDTWIRFERDDTAKVAILSGAGKSFCAGFDLRPDSITRHGPFVGLQVHQAYSENGVTEFKPRIAAIHGYVLGAGWYLAMRGCDIVVAARDTQIGFPEAKAGICIPPMDYVPTMPLKVSLAFMLLSWKGGDLMSAERAYQLGVINDVVDNESLLDGAVRWAEMLKQIPPLFIRAVKFGHYKSYETTFDRVEREYVRFVEPQENSEDVKEAARAFAERRTPVFKGR